MKQSFVIRKALLWNSQPRRQPCDRPHLNFVRHGFAGRLPRLHLLLADTIQISPAWDECYECRFFSCSHCQVSDIDGFAFNLTFLCKELAPRLQKVWDANVSRFQRPYGLTKGIRCACAAQATSNPMLFQSDLHGKNAVNAAVNWICTGACCGIHRRC